MSDINNIAGFMGRLPDIGSIPVRMEIVVAERRLALRDIQDLDEGSIIELDQVSFEPFKVKLNGREAGEGELVDIDGRLGVRIVRLKSAMSSPGSLNSGANC